MPCRALLLFAAALPTFAAETVNLDGRTFTVPDGMTIDRVAGPPLVDRPITIAFDPQGRLYAADSSGSIAKAADQLKERPHRIVRLESSDGDGVYDRQTVFADKMMFPEGTLFHAGSLYVAAPPSIWKLTDTDNDGVADRRDEWFDGKTLTNCANDLHGPYLGHDGMLYWTKGAFAKQTYTVSGKEFTTRASHIFRATPDGRNIEPVMTGGMDNPVDVAFLPSGERVLSATFLQHPAAGKRDGLVHAVYGGVYGKVHDVLDGHVRTSPDVLPVLSHLGPAASCGLHCYESAALGKQYTGNLFSCAFNLRKIVRHVLTPAGGTFTSKDEDFVTCDDADFHPTDVIEDADGSLLIVDTGGWYKLCCPTSRLHRPAALGAVYRVKRKDSAKVDDAWGLKIAWDKLTPADLAKLLDDERVMVRKRAIETIAAVGCGTGGVGDRADGLSFALRAVDAGLRSESARARLNAVWSACRIPGSEARTSVRIGLADKDDAVRIAACHAVALWRDWIAHADVARLLADPSGLVRRAAAEAAGRLGRPESVRALLDAGEREFRARRRDPFVEHSLVYALAELAKTSDAAKFEVVGATREGPFWLGAVLATDAADAWPDRRESAAWLDRVTREWRQPYQMDEVVWVLARRPGWGPEPNVRGFFKNYLEGMALDLEGRGAPADDERRKTRDRLRRLVAHDTGERVAIEFLRSDKQRRLRLELLSAVTDGWVGKSTEWVGALAQCVGDPDREIAAAAIAGLRKIAPDGRSAGITDTLRALASDTTAPIQARLGALAAWPPTAGRGAAKGAEPLQPDWVALLVNQLAPDALPAARPLAAEVLARHKLPANALLTLAKSVETAGPLELPHLLAALSQTSDPTIGEALVAALEKSKAAQALRPDAVRAALKPFPAEIQAKAAPLLARLAPDAEKQKARLDELTAKLPAGDVGRGQTVFHSAKAACAACHTVGYVGGKVGPDLTRIGAIRHERDLLESVVFPSASFVQTYEPTIVELADGDVVSGIVRKNDDDAIVLATGPEQETRVPRKDVKEVRPGQLSVMPAGLDQQLTPQELADLIAFLKACK